MSFVGLPASIPDIHAVYDAYFAAFDGDLITQILFPWDIHNEDVRKGHAEHTLEYWERDKLQYTFKCVDTDTDQIVGMSLWDFHWKERSYEECKLPPVDWLEVVGGKRHVYCHVVAVHPDHQRKGIGTLLTKPGLGVAEQLKVPVYLEGTDRAVKMYQNLGIEKLSPGVALASEIVGTTHGQNAPHER